MKIFKTIFIVCYFCLVSTGSLVLAQSEDRSKDKSIPALARDRTKINQVELGDDFPADKIKSPFRYVIVDDDLQFDESDDGKEKVPVRRYVTVLMEERAFSKVNLIYLLKYLSNFYADPLYLQIEVHTSLMTLETLEESAAMSTHSSRDDFRKFHKTASYSRFNDGSEVFLYDTGKSGNFVSKSVLLSRRRLD